MSLNQFVQEREKIFDKAEKQLSGNFNRINQEIYRQILDVVNLLDIEGGNIATNQRNLRITSEISGLIRNAISNTDYTSRVDAYLKDFDLVAEENFKYHSSTLSGVGRPINRAQQMALENTRRALLSSGVDAQFVSPLENLMIDNINSGATRMDVEDGLRRFILGVDDKEGKLQRYVGQVANDAIHQYDGQIQRQIQEEYQLNAISYEGSLINDSRPQCVRWVSEFGGVLKRSELANEIAWAFRNGSGMIPGTNPETFLSYRGGYRCRHTSTAINV